MKHKQTHDEEFMYRRGGDDVDESQISNIYEVKQTNNPI